MYFADASMSSSVVCHPKDSRSVPGANVGDTRRVSSTSETLSSAGCAALAMAYTDTCTAWHAEPANPEREKATRRSNRGIAMRGTSEGAVQSRPKASLRSFFQMTMLSIPHLSPRRQNEGYDYG